MSDNLPRVLVVDDEVARFLEQPSRFDSCMVCTVH